MQEILINKFVWMCVRKIRRINLRIMYVSICMKREFWTVIVVYASGMERSRKREMSFGRN